MWHYIKNSILINLILLMFAFVLGYAAFPMIKQAILVRREAEDLRSSLEELRVRKKELEAALVEFEQPEAVRREAKERLNLKRQGERVVVVVPEAENIEEEYGLETFWHKLRSFFPGLWGL